MPNTGAWTEAQVSNYVRRRAKLALEAIDQSYNYTPTLSKYFPIDTNFASEKIERYYYGRNPGVYKTTLEGVPESIRKDFTKVTADMHWSKYPVTVGDSARTKIAVDNILAQGTADAQNWFDFVRDYDIITALKAGHHASCTAPATGVWTDESSRNIDKDISAAFQAIITYGGAARFANTNFICIYPAKAVGGLNELDIVGGNVVSKMEDYLQQSWSGKITFVPWGPTLDENGNAYLDIAGTSADALGTSAIVCATGPRVLINGEWRPPEVNRAETWREPGTAEHLLFKMCSGAMVVPMLGSTTTTPLIYEITNVTS